MKPPTPKSPLPSAEDLPVLSFHQGTLTWRGGGPDQLPPGFTWDDRVGAGRAAAMEYRAAVESLRATGTPFRDQARAWQPLAELRHLATRDPRPYQTEALEAWRSRGSRGLVVLPTGTGKSYLAEMCILHTARPTLVVVPTIDLLSQWARRLDTAFGGPVGVLGGGSHTLGAITVSTYASALIHAHRYGDRFGLVVFDEVHHLPTEHHQAIAESMLAPFRLGLSATPERADEAHQELDRLVGPVAYRRDIGEMAGEWLAPYETVRLEVQLSPDELATYEELRGTYRRFIRAERIDLRQQGGWERFLQASARSKAGRAAHKAWRRSRAISQGTERKLDLLEDILEEEADRPTLIFTEDNATVHRISREMLLPCITHETGAAERRSILEGLIDGTCQAIVTSRVLNEGVDLPAVEVGIVVSGSGSVREHVQRLGRILRPGHGKQAVLYELVALGTTEEGTSRRRREHEAYQ